MRRLLSYLAAVVTIGLMLAGVLWALRSEALTATTGIRKEGALAFKTLPPGANGPLKTCVVCHSVEQGGPLRVAPNLHGIVGSPKARASWFAYSKALKGAGGQWSEADLHKYLTAPSQFLPGTSKTLAGIVDARQRAEIIAALKAGL